MEKMHVALLKFGLIRNSRTEEKRWNDFKDPRTGFIYHLSVVKTPLDVLALSTFIVNLIDLLQRGRKTLLLNCVRGRCKKKVKKTNKC